MRIAKRYLSDFIGLLFPELCNGCGADLAIGEKDICINCLLDLPFTDYHLYTDNKVAKQLWARLPCTAMALLFFKKGSKVQQLMHNLKYNGKADLGIRLGVVLGEKIQKSVLYQGIDLIIPVPLHARKQKIRGYNQSECIAIGLSRVIDVPVNTTCLVRNQLTATQTRKNRFTRFENMQTVFEVLHCENLKNLHILLVDDVITTGATLEACGLALFNAGINKLSIATVAFTE